MKKRSNPPGSLTDRLPGLKALSPTAQAKAFQFLYPRLRAKARRPGADSHELAVSATLRTIAKVPTLNERRFPLESAADLTGLAHQQLRDKIVATARRRNGLIRECELRFPDGTPMRLEDLPTQNTAVPAPMVSATVGAGPRIKQICALKVEGYTNREIADHLGVSSKTVQRDLRRTAIRH